MLGQFIDNLKKVPKGTIFTKGFNKPHSYRGSYYELAVQPASNIKVEDMINDLEDVLDTQLEGYKGGEFLMHYNVDVYLSHYGIATGSIITGYGITNTGEYILTTEQEV